MQNLENTSKYSKWTKKTLIIVSIIFAIYLIINVIGLFFIGTTFNGLLSIFNFIVSFILYIIFISGIKFVNKIIKDLGHSLEIQKELTIQNNIMEQISKIDALTGLYNPRTFHKCMLELTEQNEKDGLPIQLAIIDIDHFKKVNDTYGHSAGDIVLKTIAENIKNSVTSSDIVSRYGGEEFAVIFTNKTLQEAADILEKMREKISQIHFEEIEWNVTISAGIHEHIKYEHKDQSFIKADKALYKAKNGGRNRIVINE